MTSYKMAIPSVESYDNNHDMYLVFNVYLLDYSYKPLIKIDTIKTNIIPSYDGGFLIGPEFNTFSLKELEDFEEECMLDEIEGIDDTPCLMLDNYISFTKVGNNIEFRAENYKYHLVGYNKYQLRYLTNSIQNLLEHTEEQYSNVLIPEEFW